MALLTLWFLVGPLGADAFAQTSTAVPPTAPVSTDAARDSALKAFLQKRFKIVSAEAIQFGPAFETPIKGIYARKMSIATDQGQSITASLFFDRDETKAIIGQYLDLDADPWGRIGLSAIHLDDRPTLGPAEAPITIVEFADFECPYCAHAFSMLETMVNTSYKGKLKVIFKNYPLNLHPWAIKAAAAAECARLQNPAAFWDFARYFYSNQGSISPRNVQDHAARLAAKQKLDGAALKACMASTQTADRVKQDQADGNEVRVTSTPTFFVNGIPVVGLPDNKVLDFVINSELNDKSAAAH